MHILRMLLFSYYISLIAVYIVFKLFLSWWDLYAFNMWKMRLFIVGNTHGFPSRWMKRSRFFASPQCSFYSHLSARTFLLSLLRTSARLLRSRYFSCSFIHLWFPPQNLIQSGNLEQAMASMPEPWDMKRTILVQYPQASIKSYVLVSFGHH